MRPWSAKPDSQVPPKPFLRPSSAGHYPLGSEQIGGGMPGGVDGRFALRTGSAGSARMLRPTSALVTIMEAAPHGDSPVGTPVSAQKHASTNSVGLDDGELAPSVGEPSVGEGTSWDGDDAIQAPEWTRAGSEASERGEAGLSPAYPHQRPRTASPDGHRRMLRMNTAASSKASGPSATTHQKPPRVPRGVQGKVEPVQTSRDPPIGKDWGSPIIGEGSSGHVSPADSKTKVQDREKEDGQGRRLSVEDSDDDFRKKMLGARAEIGAMWSSFRLKSEEEKRARRQEHEEILAMERSKTSASEEGEESEERSETEDDEMFAEFRESETFRPGSAPSPMGGWAFDRKWQEQHGGDDTGERRPKPKSARSLSEDLQAEIPLAGNSRRPEFESPERDFRSGARADPVHGRTQSSSHAGLVPEAEAAARVGMRWSARAHSASAVMEGEGEALAGGIGREQRSHREVGEGGDAVRNGHLDRGNVAHDVDEGGEEDGPAGNLRGFAEAAGGQIGMDQIRLMTRRLGAKEREELAWSLLEEVVGADGTRAFSARRIGRRSQQALRPASSPASALADIPIRPMFNPSSMVRRPARVPS